MTRSCFVYVVIVVASAVAVASVVVVVVVAAVERKFNCANLIIAQQHSSIRYQRNCGGVK